MARKDWKIREEERYLKEQEIKRERDSTDSPIVRELKSKGNIREAAAVFSQEGFTWLIDQLGDIVAQKLEPKVREILDEKITEVLQGLTDGVRNTDQVATRAIQETVSSLYRPVKTNKGPIHKWTPGEKTMVLSTVEQFIREGKTAAEAFRYLSTKIPGVTPEAISTRYYVWIKKGEKQNEQKTAAN